MTTIAVRTTCGKAIGFGHLRRCLTLAEELAARGLSCRLWLTGDAASARLAADAGFPAELVPPGPPAMLERLRADVTSLVIVDDYAVSRDELALLRGVARVAVLDDLADRVLDVDLVQNGNADALELVYRVPANCRLLLGPRYSLLRSRFRGAPRRLAPPMVQRVLVMLGGSDPRGLTAKMTAMCLDVLPHASVDVVLGPLAESSPALESLAVGGRVVLHHAPADPASLMLGSDLAVSAGGQTNYELAALGVPALSLCVAENQRGSLAALARIPTLLAADPDEPQLPDRLLMLASDADLRQRMSDAGRRCLDGMGAGRVADAIVELTAQLPTGNAPQQSGERHG